MPIRTLDDLDTLYGGKEWGDLVRSVIKADEPVLTSSTGVLSTHYGPQLWLQMNMERNGVGILPKKPFGPERGWRVVTGFPTTMITGVAENGLRPDSSMEDFAQVFTLPKTMVTVFNSSELELRTATLDNQAVLWQDRVAMNAEFHLKGINQSLFTGVGTLAGSLIESIDRVCSSDDEGNSCATDVDGVAIAAADVDIYNLDRHTASSWADANVLHNSDVQRVFTLDLMYDLERTVAERSGIWDSSSQVWVTGYDTYQAISNLLMGHQLFMEANFKIEKFNGVSTIPGREGGFRILMFNQKPIITSIDVKNKTNHLSPIYLLNLKYLEMWFTLPTVFQEVGVLNNNELLLDQYQQLAQYKTICELICLGFFAQGKLRDLAA